MTLDEDRAVSAGFVAETALFKKRIDAGITSVVVDSTGHVVIGGTFRGDVDFGGGPISSASDSTDYFVARYTAEGAYRFIYKGGLPQSDHGTAIATAADDSIHFHAGRRTNRVGTSQQDTYPYVGQLDATAGLGPAHWISGSEGDECRATSVAALPTGGAVAVGWFSGTLAALGVSSSSQAAFVTRYSVPGTYLWTETFLGIGRAVATLPDGDVVVAGEVTASQMIGNTPLTPTGREVVLVRYAASDGAPQVIATIGGGGLPSVSAVAVDASGSLVVIGTFEQTLQIGNDTLLSFGGTDAFVAVFSGGGHPLWARSLGGSGSDTFRGVAIGDGEIYIAGSFEQLLPLPSGSSIQSAGGSDALLAVYTSSGDLRLFERFGATASDAATAVNFDPVSAVITLAGTFWGTVNFDGTVWTASGGASFLLRRLP